MSGYTLTTDVWSTSPHAFPEAGTIEEQARALLDWAILAPSSHNSQPWAFEVDADEVRVRPDERRWLKVADADRRELNLSLGCAVENLRIAAACFGLGPQIEYAVEDSSPVITVTLNPSEPGDDDDGALCSAIANRHTHRGAFKDRTVSWETVDRLMAASSDSKAELVLIEDQEVLDAIAALQKTADERLMEDRAYREELGEWIGAGAMGDGWLKARVGQWVVRNFDLGSREGANNAELLREAPLVAILATRDDATITQVRVGQLYERLALIATSDGAATHPMSQILEVAEYREELQDEADLGDLLPQHLFRVGYPPRTGDPTPRWPVERFLM
jgi:hypothetical protein